VLKSPFHKQTPPAKVQILGVLEAAGQLFDGLWWLGLTAHAWPEPLKPNPLLPTALQREHKMPRANAHAELAYARAITQRLLRSAPQVLVSHALFNGDEPLSPSPLIEAIPAAATATINTLHPWQCLPLAEAEVLFDEQAPALAVPVELKGGVSVIRRQAACPFQAFAVHRLGAASLEPIGEGLDHRDKGNLIHEVLEHIWQQLGTQEQLFATDDDALDALIDGAINTAITRLAQGRSLGKKLLALEAVRVKRRIYSWLEQERARAPFTVSLQEKTLPLEVAGLKLRLRMDRVDCLADGKTLAVIDYKTGQSNIKSWQWPRIDEPQIPLYATAMPEVGAAVFAQVNTQEMKYIGLTAVPEMFEQLTDPNGHKDWQADFATVLSEWQQALHAIAVSFVQGDARVAPKVPKTCEWCELKPLCRIAERAGWQDSALEDDE
jgi:probable DNA repair protein